MAKCQVGPTFLMPTVLYILTKTYLFFVTLYLINSQHDVTWLKYSIMKLPNDVSLDTHRTAHTKNND